MPKRIIELGANPSFYNVFGKMSPFFNTERWINPNSSSEGVESSLKKEWDVFEPYFTTDAAYDMQQLITDSKGAVSAGDPHNTGSSEELLAAGSAYGLMALGDIEANRKTRELLDPLSGINMLASTQGGDLGYFADGGFAGGKVQYQTEKGEMLVLPDNSIIEVAATKKHDNNPSDKVTDELYPGTYIASARKEINKKDAEKILISRTSTTYKEGEKPKEPKQTLLSDIFTDKKHTVAELIKKVQKLFPVEDLDTTDEAIKNTNELNKLQREPYLKAIIGLAEMGKKNNKSNDMNYAKEGGYVKNKDVPKAFTGLEIAALAQAGSGIVNTAGNLINLYMATKEAKKAKEEIATAYGKTRNYLGAGAGLALGSTLMQDEEFTAPDLKSTLGEIQSQPDKLPYEVTRSINESGDINMRNVVEEIFKNSDNYSTAMNSIQSLYGKGVESTNNSNLDIAKLNSEMKRVKSSQLATIKETIARENANAVNQRRSGRNQKIKELGNTSMAYFNELGNLELGETNARMAVNAALADARQKSVSAFTQNITGGANAVSTLAGGLTNRDASVTTPLNTLKPISSNSGDVLYDELLKRLKINV